MRLSKGPLASIIKVWALGYRLVVVCLVLSIVVRTLYVWGGPKRIIFRSSCDEINQRNAKVAYSAIYQEQKWHFYSSNLNILCISSEKPYCAENASQFKPELSVGWVDPQVGLGWVKIYFRFQWVALGWVDCAESTIFLWEWHFYGNDINILNITAEWQGMTLIY